MDIEILLGVEVVEEVPLMASSIVVGLAFVADAAVSDPNADKVFHAQLGLYYLLDLGELQAGLR